MSTFPFERSGQRERRSFSFCSSAGLQSPLLSFTGQDMDRRRGGGGKKRKKARGRARCTGGDADLSRSVFLGEREEEPLREDRVLSPPPLSRESVLYASFDAYKTTMRPLGNNYAFCCGPFFWPFGGGWLRERKAAAWKTRKGKSRSQLEVEKKEETSLSISFFHSLHPSFLVQQQQQHETACSAPPLNFRMRPA